MRLRIDPPTPLAIFTEELELIVVVPEVGIPSIFAPPGVPRPDRRLVLGLIECAAAAVSEDDRDCVALMDHCSVSLELNGEIKGLESSFIVARGKQAVLGVLVAGTRQDARRRARQAVRYFTGTIRLDAP
ncbi:MAG: hypothetical protein FJ118_05140 [Deltaproteobacteria bacterium]|nr:hypothetical protein [Deltaproteobacteria bacterium]